MIPWPRPYKNKKHRNQDWHSNHLNPVFQKQDSGNKCATSIYRRMGLCMFVIRSDATAAVPSGPIIPERRDGAALLWNYIIQYHCPLQINLTQQQWALYIAGIRQPLIPVVYVAANRHYILRTTATLVNPVCGKGFPRHYSDNRHYSTGTIQGPLRKVFLCLALLVVIWVIHRVALAYAGYVFLKVGSWLRYRVLTVCCTFV